MRGVGSTGEFGGFGGGSSNGIALPEDIDGAGPLWTVGWKVIWLLDQSIDGLYCLSQLYPKTAEQEESSDVT